MKGEVGEKGEAGVKGDIGPQGMQGMKGERGDAESKFSHYLPSMVDAHRCEAHLRALLLQWL